MGYGTYLVEEVYIGLSLELFECPVLLQGPRVQLLVGSDDVNAFLHPLQIPLRRGLAGCGIYDD